MYYEVAEGGIPAVQGMARTHEGVLEVAPKAHHTSNPNLMKLEVHQYFIALFLQQKTRAGARACHQIVLLGRIRCGRHIQVLHSM